MQSKKHRVREIVISDFEDNREIPILRLWVQKNHIQVKSDPDVLSSIH
jgi:hypothetical protein